MGYKQSDYGPNPHKGASRNNAAARGWGSGFPNCQRNKWVIIEKGGVRLSIRREVAELVATLLTATEKRGYNVKADQTSGSACRAIRGSKTASNHSWGLAIDINSRANPMQKEFRSDIPPKVVEMWEACGFYWGGRYQTRKDAMHFEYIFKPSDVAKHLELAKKYSGAPAQKPVNNGNNDSGKYTDTKYGTYAKVKAGSRTIKQGSAGDDVRELQKILNAKFPDASKLTSDGYFGPKTRTRVLKLQKAKKLLADGIVGPKTWKALGVSAAKGKPKVLVSKLISAAKIDPPKASSHAHYAHGTRVVEAALRKEGLLEAKQADSKGHFGRPTVTAYGKWQKRLGYSGKSADGIPGRTSLTKLGQKYGFEVA